MDELSDDDAKALRDVLAWLDQKYDEAGPHDKPEWLDRRARVATGDSQAREEALTAMREDQRAESR